MDGSRDGGIAEPDGHDHYRRDDPRWRLMIGLDAGERLDAMLEKIRAENGSLVIRADLDAHSLEIDSLLRSAARAMSLRHDVAACDGPVRRVWSAVSRRPGEGRLLVLHGAQSIDEDAADALSTEMDDRPELTVVFVLSIDDRLPGSLGGHEWTIDAESD